MTKRSILIALLVIPMFFQWLNSIKEDETSKGARETHKLVSKTTEIIQSKYDLHVMGIGESGDKEKIEELNIFFKSDIPLSKTDARKIIMYSVQQFLNDINNSKELEPFLMNKPFTEDNLRIKIFITDQGKTLYDPNISVVSTYKNKIEYLTNDPLNEYKYRSETEETFEEALEKLKSSTN